MYFEAVVVHKVTLIGEEGKHHILSQLLNYWSAPITLMKFCCSSCIFIICAILETQIFLHMIQLSILWWILIGIPYWPFYFFFFFQNSLGLGLWPELLPLEAFSQRARRTSVVWGFTVLLFKCLYSPGTGPPPAPFLCVSGLDQLWNCNCFWTVFHLHGRSFFFSPLCNVWFRFLCQL